jgi:hypothetical protein
MACPVSTNNKNPFSYNKNLCKYDKIEYDIPPANEPFGSERTRNPMKMNVLNSKHLRYSVPESTKGLDLLYECPEKSTVFPRNIYEKNPFGYSASYLIAPRDKELLYTYSSDSSNLKERSRHTLHASRFGYDRFVNEYGLGTQVFGYLDPNECTMCSQDTPKNMAPERFYTDFYLKQSHSEFEKMLNEGKTTPLFIKNKNLVF